MILTMNKHQAIIRRNRMMKSQSISERLIELGLNPSLLGFGYLEYCIQLFIMDPLQYYNGKRSLFIMIDECFGVSRMKSSRCMQYAIQCAWFRPNNTKLHNIFPACHEQYPPLIQEFICGIGLMIYEEERGNFFSNLIKQYFDKKNSKKALSLNCDQ